jgi:hypothetical protein
MCDLSTADGTADGSYRVWINGTENADLTRTGKDTDYITVNRFYLGAYTGNTNPDTWYTDDAALDTVYIDLLETTPGYKSFTADALLQSTFTRTFTADIILELSDYVIPVAPAVMQGSLSFLNVIAQLERYNGIKQVFEPGVCVPGMDNFECPLRTIIKKMET